MASLQRFYKTCLVALSSMSLVQKPLLSCYIFMSLFSLFVEVKNSRDFRFRLVVVFHSGGEVLATMADELQA